VNERADGHTCANLLLTISGRLHILTKQSTEGNRFLPHDATQSEVLLWGVVIIIIIIIIIIINDIYRAQTSPRSKCAKSAVARLQFLEQEHFQSFPERWQ